MKSTTQAAVDELARQLGAVKNDLHQSTAEFEIAPNIFVTIDVRRSKRIVLGTSVMLRNDNTGFEHPLMDADMAGSLYGAAQAAVFYLIGLGQHSDDSTIKSKVLKNVVVAQYDDHDVSDVMSNGANHFRSRNR